MSKVKQHDIRYFNLNDLLDALETERSGIRERVRRFLSDEWDIQFQLISGRILGMNLYFYGVGNEYPIHDTDEKEIEHSKIIHPEAFIDGTPENELRKDFNLIWSTYDVRGEEIEVFYIIG